MDPAATQSVASYLDALAARTPAPASGSGAALTGAIAAALAALAARFSGDEASAARLDDLLGRLLRLADDDTKAYTAFMRTRSHADRDRPSAATPIADVAPPENAPARAWAYVHVLLPLLAVLAYPVTCVVVNDVTVTNGATRIRTEPAAAVAVARR